MGILPCFHELLSTVEQKYFNPLQIKGKIPKPKSLLLRVKLHFTCLHLSAKPQHSCLYLSPVSQLPGQH